MADPSRFLLSCLQELTDAQLRLLCQVVDEAFDTLSSQLIVYNASFEQVRATVCSAQNKMIGITNQISNMSSILATLNEKPCSLAVRDMLLLINTLPLIQVEFQTFIDDVLSLPALIDQQAALAARSFAVRPLIDFLRGFRNILRFRLGVC